MKPVRPLYGQNLLALIVHFPVNLCDETICQLLDLVFPVFLIVLGQLVALLHLFKGVIGIATDVADSNLRRIALLFNLLGQLLTTSLRHLRKQKPDHRTIVLRIDADI